MHHGTSQTTAKSMRAVFCIFSLLLIAPPQAFAEAAKPDYGFTHAEDIRADGYEFKFLKAGPADKDGYRKGYFKFRWKGPKAVHLWGFGFEKDGSFQSRFEIFSKKTKSGWEEIKVGFCGTGAETFALEAGKDYVIQFPLERYAADAEQWVVKLDGEKISVVSEPFKIADPKGKR